tara:strand:+ start:335 stop:475 length:141 start_codon:yes stop_codon:yes gene_type:complete
MINAKGYAAAIAIDCKPPRPPENKSTVAVPEIIRLQKIFLAAEVDS